MAQNVLLYSHFLASFGHYLFHCWIWPRGIHSRYSCLHWFWLCCVFSNMYFLTVMAGCLSQEPQVVESPCLHKAQMEKIQAAF